MNVRRLHRQRGQGLVEFAVLLPIMGILIAAIIDGGLLMGRYNGTNHAATVGARFAAVQRGPAGSASRDIVARVKEYAPGNAGDYATSCDFSANDAAICVEWLDGPNGEAAGDVGSSICVAVKYHYPGLTPVISQRGGWDVKARVVQVQEQALSGSVPTPNSGSPCAGAGGG